MYTRFEHAINATKTTDLLILSTVLSEIVQECIKQSAVPHMDPAVMLVCYQIAFSGNGDFPDPNFYRNLYKACKQKTEDPTMEIKIEQPYSPS